MQTTTQLTTQDQVRDSFWENSPYKPSQKAIPFTQSGRRLYRAKTQNEYPTDIRVAWVEWVDYLARSGVISQALASRVTL